MTRPWWKSAIVYQVYPRSFLDTNGDGIGDLPGITARLDYLQSLGVTALWLSPVYQSPNDDNGYDISDYRAIMPEFGTMADFDMLLHETHRRGMKLIMDLVVNHTSDEHPWFVESRASRQNPKRDWYIWRPGREGREPNNWSSFFSPSAWEWDPVTREYYLHLFSRKQPDLNWANPEVRSAVVEMMRWWLDKGVDGFRMDVINLLAKPEGLPDGPIPVGETTQRSHGGAVCANQPRIHSYLQEIHREVLRHYDILAVGECCFLSPELAPPYVEKGRNELDMVFQFDIMHAGRDVACMRERVQAWHTTLHPKAHGSVTLGNHDSPRQVSRLGNDASFRVESATLLATFVLTAPGTPFLYQGEELGMTNVCFPRIEDYRDIEMLNRYRERTARGESPQAVLEDIRTWCRDNARTPMQWTDEPQAGFTSGTPWIGVNPNYPQINARDQEADPGSVLNYYRRMIRVRREHEALVWGEYAAFDDFAPPLFVYRRSLAEETLIVALNFSDTLQPLKLESLRSGAGAEILISNYPDAGPASTLRPWEATVFRLSAGNAAFAE